MAREQAIARIQPPIPEEPGEEAASALLLALLQALDSQTGAVREASAETGGAAAAPEEVSCLAHLSPEALSIQLAAFRPSEAEAGGLRETEPAARELIWAAAAAAAPAAAARAEPEASAAAAAAATPPATEDSEEEEEESG